MKARWVLGEKSWASRKCWNRWASSWGMGAKTLSLVFFTAWLSKVDTILTLWACNWSDKGGYSPTLAAGC